MAAMQQGITHHPWRYSQRASDSQPVIMRTHQRQWPSSEAEWRRTVTNSPGHWPSTISTNPRSRRHTLAWAPPAMQKGAKPAHSSEPKTLLKNKPTRIIVTISPREDIMSGSPTPHRNAKPSQRPKKRGTPRNPLMPGEVRATTKQVARPSANMQRTGPHAPTNVGPHLSWTQTATPQAASRSAN